MDIFVRNVPIHATKKQIEKTFHGPFAEFGITTWHVEKIRNKPCAILTVLDRESGLRFLTLYGVPPNSPARFRAIRTLSWDGKFLQCSESHSEPSDFSLRSLAYERTQHLAKAQNIERTAQNGQGNKKITRFAIQGLQCGTWDYAHHHLVFASHFRDNRQGSITFGLSGAVIVLGGSEQNQCRIDLSYHDCSDIILGSYADPTVSFSLRIPPKFYEIQGEDILAAALMAITLGPAASKGNKVTKKVRLTSIDAMHAKVAATCFVYRITLSEYASLSIVRSLLGSVGKAPSTLSLGVPTMQPPESLEQSFARLNHELTDTNRYGSLPFDLLFQIQRLASNAILSPLKVRALLPTIKHLHQQFGLDATLFAVRRFYRRVPLAGPETYSHEHSTNSLASMLEDFTADYDRHEYNPENPYQLIKRHSHINLIHKVNVTPVGTYLEGPEPEPTNRVLRRYADHTDHFIRVVFMDEDGGSVRYDPKASQERIFHERFKRVLDGNVLIAGRGFSFLGFSHSSLRAQSCWFMAPMFLEGSFRLPEHILGQLGDFTSIRVPAKCAARIGQNFTDTNPTVNLREDMVYELPVVVRNNRDFSDGVGTISESLLRDVWHVYGTRRQLKPTVLQVRFQGCKGMVSLDSRLGGRRLMLRSNMKKFETRNEWNLEICSAGFKPLPMILNRQLIKILEDLGMSSTTFMEVQKAAVDALRLRTTSPTNTAGFLEEEAEHARATRLPSLIRLLNKIGLNYNQDAFLYSVVELIAVTKLRDIKYRGRIPIQHGHTLYGIMDETGFLQEGEVYIAIEKQKGGRENIVRNPVVVSRSPAMHPGDVQIVSAVQVPDNSPLKRLSNVVVFSQRGTRDLPSKLSGGDLDGDLYQLIWDERLIPPTTYQAADYPRVSAVALDRPVTRKDMSDFLVTFMESDQLGLLSNVHMQLADQRPTGTLDPACLQLASMASTAVDFSKTGIPVDMRQCPRYPRFRPEFMSPSPRMVLSGQFVDIEDEEDEQDEAFEGLDAERRSFRYYESTKVLGQLFRAIDERQFLAKMQDEHRNAAIQNSSTSNVLGTLLAYLKRVAKQYGIQHEHQLELAANIRADYEHNLTDILHYYGPAMYMPLSEQEAFAGTILGRKGGAQGKPLRDLSKTMRERFEAVVEYTVMRIVKGDKQVQGVTDLDLLYDDSVDREVEALPRTIACLEVAIEEPGIVESRQLGELESFKYISAGVCLRELERYRMTTYGSYTMPTVKVADLRSN